MENKELISKLNHFYTLEVAQVDTYLAQGKYIKDKYIKISLERIAALEQEHVENLAKLILALGEQPSIIGDVVSPLVGISMGTLLSLTDFSMMMELNIRLEVKAAQDYMQLIKKLEAAEHPGLDIIHTLKYNMIDEDLHSSWFYELLKFKGNNQWPLNQVLIKNL